MTSYPKSHTGKRYGRLVVLEDGPPIQKPGKQKRRTVIVQCDCGETKRVELSNVVRGDTTSCGCLARKINADRLRTHGMSRTGCAEYRAWSTMNARCAAKQGNDFRNYAQRGIEVCPRWHSFENFLADMGQRPSKQHSLDRINNDLGYSPENCRWATPIEQATNRRTNVLVPFGGQDICLQEAARMIGIHSTTLADRMKKWPQSEWFVPAKHKDGVTT